MGDGICPKLSFGLFSVTMDHKFVLNVKKSAKNGQFIMKVIKKSPLCCAPFGKLALKNHRAARIIFLIIKFYFFEQQN